MTTRTGVDHGGVHDLGFARLDTDRVVRTGDPEVVFGMGKSPEQTVALLRTLHATHPDRAALATRLSDAALDAVAADVAGAVLDRTARTATVGPLPQPRGLVAIVSAGTSDAPLAREAEGTARAHPVGARRRESPRRRARGDVPADLDHRRSRTAPPPNSRSNVVRRPCGWTVTRSA